MSSGVSCADSLRGKGQGQDHPPLLPIGNVGGQQRLGLPR